MIMESKQSKLRYEMKDGKLNWSNLNAIKYSKQSFAGNKADSKTSNLYFYLTSLKYSINSKYLQNIEFKNLLITLT